MFLLELNLSSRELSAHTITSFENDLFISFVFSPSQLFFLRFERLQIFRLNHSCSYTLVLFMWQFIKICCAVAFHDAIDIIFNIEKTQNFLKNQFY